jgi:hypothetical protein
LEWWQPHCSSQSIHQDFSRTCREGWILPTHRGRMLVRTDCLPLGGFDIMLSCRRGSGHGRKLDDSGSFGHGVWVCESTSITSSEMCCNNIGEYRLRFRGTFGDNAKSSLENGNGTKLWEGSSAASNWPIRSKPQDQK